MTATAEKEKKGPEPEKTAIGTPDEAILREGTETIVDTAGTNQEKTDIIKKETLNLGPQKVR